MNKIILHIPHSSLHIPFYDGYVVNKEAIEAEQLVHTDWYTDDLFQSENTIPVVAEFSRIFCDPERFEDDALEIMSAQGMGVLYEKTDNGERLRNVEEHLRKRVIDGFYKIHHQKLSAAVSGQLNKHGKALIIDCHSFPPRPLNREIHKELPRPDYNIGTDPFHTPPYLVEQARQFFAKRNLSLGVDWPYSGSMVPLEHYQKNKRVQSIMLEINRSLYLEEGINIKTNNYENVKKTVSEFIEMLLSNLKRQHHQGMLSAIVTKGYQNLSEEEKRYWSSVY